MSAQGYTNMLEKYRDVDEDEIMSALSKDELARLENEIDREILEKAPAYESYESESYTTASSTDDSEPEETIMENEAEEEEQQQESQLHLHNTSRGKPEAFTKGKLDKTQLKPIQKTLQRQKSKDKHTFKLPALKKTVGPKTDKMPPGQEANTELKDELIQAVKKRDNKRRTKRVNSSGIGRRPSSGVPRPRRNSRVARYRDGNEHQVDAAIVNRNYITDEMLNLRPKLKKVQVKEPKLVLPEELHGVSFNRITAGARSKEDGENVEEEMEEDPEPAVSEPAVSEDGNASHASRSSAFGYDADVDVTPSDDSYALPGDECEIEERKERHKAMSESSEAPSDGVAMASTTSTSAESCDVFGELSINPNSVEEMLERVRENDPMLTEVNLNNIHDVPIERFEELAEAMEDNTHVSCLSLANTGLTDRAARALASMLKRNKTLKKLNIESNFITGEGGRRIVSALRKNNCLIELSLDNQRHIFGAKVEHEMSKMLRENTSLLKFGYQFANPGPRMATSNILTKNMDLVRKKRVAEEKKRQHGGQSKRPQLRRQPSSEWYRRERLKKLHDTSKLLGLDPSKADNKDVEKVLKNMNPEEVSLLERWFTSKLLGVVDAPPSAPKDPSKKIGAKAKEVSDKPDGNLLRPPARQRRSKSPPANRDQLLDSIRKQNTKLKKVKLRPSESPSRHGNTDSDVEVRPLAKDSKNEAVRKTAGQEPGISRESQREATSSQRTSESHPKSPEIPSLNSTVPSCERKNDDESGDKPSTSEPIIRKTPSPKQPPRSGNDKMLDGASSRFRRVNQSPSPPKAGEQETVQVKPVIMTTEPSFDEPSAPDTAMRRTPDASSSEEMFTASDAETGSHKSDDRCLRSSECKRSPSPEVREWKEGEEYDSDEYEIVEIEVTDSEDGDVENTDTNEENDGKSDPVQKSPEVPTKGFGTSQNSSQRCEAGISSPTHKSLLSNRLARSRPPPFASSQDPNPGPKSPAEMRGGFSDGSKSPHSMTSPSTSLRSNPLSPPTPRSNAFASPVFNRSLSRTSNSSADSSKFSPKYTHPTPPKSSRQPRPRVSDEDVEINPKALSTIESFFSFK